MATGARERPRSGPFARRGRLVRLDEERSLGFARAGKALHFVRDLTPACTRRLDPGPAHRHALTGLSRPGHGGWHLAGHALDGEATGVHGRTAQTDTHRLSSIT
jgi:hypothetical protein